MSSASSCKIFETFSTAIQAIFQYYNPQAHCIHMIDDFLILADTENQCNHNLQRLLNICSDIGIPMAPNKTTRPSTNTTFLGIELDTITQSAKLPMDKLQEYSTLLNQYINQEKNNKAQPRVYHRQTKFCSISGTSKAISTPANRLVTTSTQTVLLHSTHKPSKERFAYLETILSPIQWYHILQSVRRYHLTVHKHVCRCFARWFWGMLWITMDPASIS